MSNDLYRDWMEQLSYEAEKEIAAAAKKRKLDAEQKKRLKERIVLAKLFFLGMFVVFIAAGIYHSNFIGMMLAEATVSSGPDPSLRGTPINTPAKKARRMYEWRRERDRDIDDISR